MTAYWLAKHGWDVVVIERAEQLRLGGQNIDITDAAREVVRMMGIEDTIRAHHTGEKGVAFVDAEGRVTARFPVEEKGSLTREIEILRGDLVKIIVDANPESVEYRYGRSIDALGRRDDGVTVTFDDGATEDFDVVIAADGMNSRTRELVIGPDARPRDYLGCWSSYFTLPRREGDDDWWRWYTSANGIVAFLRPDNEGTMRSSVNFLSDDDHPPHMSLDEKRKRLQDRLRGSGWECDRIADDLEGVDDIYLGPLHQIKADRWSDGRCVLAGDAAHCPTPYTGMGTTLAIIGAYVLAGELATHDRPEDAFAAYERRFRDFAETNQKLPPGVPDIAYAQSEMKRRLINLGAKVAASSPVQSVASFFDGGKRSEQVTFDLPDYGGRKAA
ncbi:FAD-dependent monooxygenase [Jannaschia sp. Os4]|nr:FAD-dependent monooxygenase [Jannaschia sp. Os4]